jgi:hypothetical protein
MKCLCCKAILVAWIVVYAVPMAILLPFFRPSKGSCS